MSAWLHHLIQVAAHLRGCPLAQYASWVMR